MENEKDICGCCMCNSDETYVHYKFQYTDTFGLTTTLDKDDVVFDGMEDLELPMLLDNMKNFLVSCGYPFVDKLEIKTINGTTFSSEY